MFSLFFFLSLQVEFPSAGFLVEQSKCSCNGARVTAIIKLYNLAHFLKMDCKSVPSLVSQNLRDIACSFTHNRPHPKIVKVSKSKQPKSTPKEIQKTWLNHTQPLLPCTGSLTKWKNCLWPSKETWWYWKQLSYVSGSNLHPVGKVSTEFSDLPHGTDLTY